MTIILRIEIGQPQEDLLCRVVATGMSKRNEKRVEGVLPWTLDMHDEVNALFVQPQGVITNELRKFGAHLFNMLFSPGIDQLYRSLRDQLRTGSLRIRLYIGSPEIAAWPWELMFDPQEGEYLCLNDSIFLERYIGPQATISKMRPWQMWATLPLSEIDSDLQLEREVKNIKSALRDHLEFKDKNEHPILNLNWIEKDFSTFSQLRKSNIQIFHFMGHTFLDGGEICFRIKNEVGGISTISVNDLINRLPGTLMLAVFNSCEAASGDKLLSNIGYALSAKKQVAAVIAMQFTISDTAALSFSKTLYDELAAGKNILQAVREARVNLKNLTGGVTWDWAAPVLYWNVAETRAPLTFPHPLRTSPSIIPVNLPIEAGRTTPLPLLRVKRNTWRLRYILSFIAIVCVMLTIILYQPIVQVFSPSLDTCNKTSALYAEVAIPDPKSTFVDDAELQTVMLDAENGLIGLSAGINIFDITHPDAPQMEEAARRLKRGDIQGAGSIYQSIITQENLSAKERAPEAYIYYENLRILSKNKQYRTIVIGVSFARIARGGSRDVLQGAYIAQKEYNAHLDTNKCDPVVLLIANVGADDPTQANRYTDFVANQIVKLQKRNHSIIGVMGWVFSGHTTNINPILNKEPILMLSATSSSQNLIDVPDFIRIVPDDSKQAELAADYICHNYAKLKLKIAVLVKREQDYSSSLADAVISHLHCNVDRDVIPYEQKPNESVDQTWKRISEQLQQDNVNLIYYSGYSGDLGSLLRVMDTGHILPDVDIFGGDGLAGLNNLVLGDISPASLKRLHFTAFATLDAWQKVPNYDQQPFVSRYKAEFRATTIPTLQENGITNMDADILQAYDGVSVLLRGYQIALARSHETRLADAIVEALHMYMTPEDAYQGMSGQIAFTPGSRGSEPVNKAVFVVHMGDTGTPIDAQGGCVFVHQC